MELFVAGSTARTAAEIAEVNKNTAHLFFIDCEGIAAQRAVAVAATSTPATYPANSYAPVITITLEADAVSSPTTPTKTPPTTAEPAVATVPLAMRVAIEFTEAVLINKDLILPLFIFNS